MSDFNSLIKKVNEIIDLVKADPSTKLPGVLINKAAPAPAPAPAPVQKPMTVAGAPKPPTPKVPGMQAPGMKKDAMGSMGGGAMNMNMDKAVQQPQGKPGHSNIGTIVRTALHMKQHGFPAAAKQHMGTAVQEQRNEAHRTMMEPKPNLPKSEGRDPAHLAKWMKKAVGCMSMHKNDMERERITDGVVANERRKDNQAEQRQEHKDQVSEHQKAANAYKEDKIDQDKGREVVNPANKSLIPQVVKAEELRKPYVSEAQRGKFHAMEDRGEISHATVAHWDKESKGKKLPEHVAKAGEAAPLGGTGTGAPSTPTPRPNAGFGAVVVKDQVHNPSHSNPNDQGRSEAGDVVRQMGSMQPGQMKTKMSGMVTDQHKKIFNSLKAMKKPNLP